MDEESSAENGVEKDPWALLVTRLTAFVATMTDDELRFAWPDETDGESGMTITVDQDGRRMVIESPWATDTVRFDCEPVGARVAAIEHQMLETVREWCEFCPIPHPSLARVAADGPAAAGVGVLQLEPIPPYGLGFLTTCEGMADIPDAPSSGPEQGVDWFEERDDLVAAILERLRRRELDPDLELDEDGDVPLESTAGPFYVRVLPDRPVVHVFARVLDGVESRKRTDVELNVLNRSRHWSRWSRRERSVHQELSLYAHPFVPVTFDRMLQVFVRDHQRVSGDLVDRLGGRRVG